MVKVIELQGMPQVFTLKDGKTLRIYARETKEIESSKVSTELKRAEERGFIMLSPVPKVQKASLAEETKTSKKSGGVK